jgi:hypothetical protein
MKAKHILFALLLLAVAVQLGQGFSLEGPKYTPPSYPYYINPKNLDGITNAAVISALKPASNKWKNWCAGVYKGTSTITKVSGTDGKNVVFFRNAKSGSAIATTYAFYSGKNMLGFDMVWWDAAWKFFPTAATCSNGFYIIDVATHEFGHVVGMGHSAVADATMFPSTVFCNKAIRTLAPDDVAGISKLYGHP